MTGDALRLVRTGDSAADLDAGALRYATADAFTAEVKRSVTAPGRLTVKVFRRDGDPDYFRVDSLEEALSCAESRIREWRTGEPLYPLTVPSPAAA